MKKILLIILTLTLLVGCSENNNTTNNVIENTPTNNNEAINETTDLIVEEDDTARATEFVDALGRTVTVATQPKRVISLYASFADLWYEAGGDLVGIIESSTIPEKAADLPQVGSMSTPNVEAILALEPDLIIIRAGYSKQEELIDIFESSNITVYATDYNSFDETMMTYKDFCAMNDQMSLYEERGLSMVEKIETIKKEASEYSYLLLFATSKSISTKDDNITAHIADDMGGVNITKEFSIADETTKQFSFEKILEADPKYIFVQTMGSVEDSKARMASDIESNPAWGSLTAVKEGRFIYLPKDLFLYKPNMKYVESYEYMRDLLVE